MLIEILAMQYFDQDALNEIFPDNPIWSTWDKLSEEERNDYRDKAWQFAVTRVNTV